LRLVGLTWTVPDFIMLFRRQKTLAAHIPYRDSNAPLHLLAPLGQRMLCMKLLGQRLMARGFDRQGADVQVRSAVMTGERANPINGGFVLQNAHRLLKSA
jgi:hypothetical protein